MPTKQDYIDIIEQKISAESEEKSNEKASVGGTDPNSGRDPDVSIKDK